MKGFLTAVFLGAALAAAPVQSAEKAQEPGKPDKAQATTTEQLKEQRSKTEGSVQVGGERIDYTAIAGTLVLEDKKEQPMASMSYVAYVKRGVEDPGNRPITFLYNGGPGSSTVWLHMLAFGPVRVVVGNGEMTPPAPYRMVNNQYSLLDVSDLVFVDAPGTGFGRVPEDDKKKRGKSQGVFGIDGDAQAFAQFITSFLTKYDRWNSPKYLFGESYGTTRSAVLAYILQSQKNVSLNGVILLSAILNFNISVDFPEVNPGINISYALGLPTYAATAYYHDKLPQKPDNLEAFLDEVEEFAVTDYLQALTRGNELDEETKEQIARQVHRYTGLPVAYILDADLRVTGGEFSHKLLDEGDGIAGRLDSRYRGPAMNPIAAKAMYDPMFPAISAPTVAMFNQYMRNTLKFGEGKKYNVSINVFRKWNFSHQPPNAPFPLPFTPNVMPDLAAAMKLNPDMKVLLTGGYFDIGTPYYAAEYEMKQLTIGPELQDNIIYAFYPSGHMIYIDPESHQALHDVTAQFINSTYQPQ